MRIFQTNYKNISGRSVQDSNKSSHKYQKYRELWEDNPKRGIAQSFPLNVDIEVTNACNLQCPYCARTQKNWGDNIIGFINESLVRKIINEVKSEGGYCIKFNLRGEPLLHSKLSLFLEWCKNSELLDYYFNTNGVLLIREMSQSLVKSQVPRISISTGGWDAESFSRYQVGTDLNVVRDNIIGLRNIRDKMGSQYPKIRVQAVLLDELKPHLNEFKLMWEGIADEVGLIDFREETGRQSYRSVICSDFRCNYLWQRLVILWDGTVFPCLFHGVSDARNLILGNIKDMSLKEMWNSEKMKILRNEHITGLSHRNKCCDKCSHRFTEINKIVKA